MSPPSKPLNPFLFLLLIWLSVSCNEKDSITPIILPHAQIQVGESIVARNIFNYYGTGEKYNEVDTVIYRDRFHLLRLPSGGYNADGINLTFKALFDTAFTVTYEWKIGDDPRLEQRQQFDLGFGYPAGEITIRLIATYQARNTDLSGVDTAYKRITIDDRHPLPGVYEGYNADNPGKKITISIGYKTSSHPALTLPFWGMENLPEKFPGPNLIEIKSSGFGILYDTPVGGGYYMYDSQWVNSVFAIGFLNSAEDSIVIKYNYGIIKSLSNVYDWSHVVSNVFTGKKVQ